MNPVFKGYAQEMERKRSCNKEPKEECILLRIVSEKLKILPNQLRLAKMPGTTEKTFNLNSSFQVLCQNIHIFCLCVYIYHHITDHHRYKSSQIFISSQTFIYIYVPELLEVKLCSLTAFKRSRAYWDYFRKIIKCMPRLSENLDIQNNSHLEGQR